VGTGGSCVVVVIVMDDDLDPAAAAAAAATVGVTAAERDEEGINVPLAVVLGDGPVID
jgi:hypothetical protein